jgi:SpoVK/Ycf46/Vps4 family AAA+-type ATPase
MTLLGWIRSLISRSQETVPLSEIWVRVSGIAKDSKKAEADLLKLIRSNITLANDGSLRRVIWAIPYSWFDKNQEPIYHEAVESAKTAIQLKVATLLDHERELAGMSLDDIVLSTNSRNQVQLLINTLKCHKDFSEYGIDFPTGVLFFGPPGVWKTEIARLVAKENQWAFVAIKSSDIIHGIVWESDKAITKMFEDAHIKALESGICIVFIDEAENLLRDRKQWHQHSNVAHFLGQVDGFQKKKWVFVILSTNIVSDIDPAVLSRMTNKIEFTLPDMDAIEKIFRIHLLRQVQNPDFKQKLENFLSGSHLSYIYNELFSHSASWRDIKSIANNFKIFSMLKIQSNTPYVPQIQDLKDVIQNTITVKK